MSWEDRIQELLYTSPSGLELTCLYTEVPMKLTLRGREWGFPGVDGEYIQRTGLGSKQFRIQCIFSGPEHDREADTFEAALCETGLGKLRPPFGAPLTVVPFGDLERLTRVVEGLNTSLITISFYQTIDISGPRVSLNAKGVVTAKVAIYQASAAKAYARNVDLKSAQKELREKNFITKALDTVKKGTAIASGAQRAARTVTQLQIKAVNDALTTLAGDPLKVAFECVTLMNLPGNAATALARRVAGYGNMILGIIDLIGGPSPLPAQSKNELVTADMLASSAVSGMAEAGAYERYNSRDEAISFAIALREQSDYVRIWRDDQIALVLSSSPLEDDAVDLTDSSSALDGVVDATINLLIESALDLPIRKTIVLSEPRGSLELCAELYGSVESETYERFIRDNRFSASEILEVPEGRQVVTYG